MDVDVGVDVEDLGHKPMHNKPPGRAVMTVQISILGILEKHIVFLSFSIMFAFIRLSGSWSPLSHFRPGCPGPKPLSLRR